MIHTAVGLAAGSAIAAVLTGAATTVSALAFTGLLTGAAVGATQATMLGRSNRIAAAWIALVSISWTLGWLITANVIVDAERGYITFGVSGALLVTVATGLALRRVLAVGRDREPVGTPRSRPVAAARR